MMRHIQLPRCARVVLGTSLAVWACAVSAGLWMLWGYAAGAGPTADAPVKWPSQSAIFPAGDLPTLVMLAHPQCPCTRASIQELAVLMARCQGKVAAHVVFMKPAGLPRDWEQTGLWRDAQAIPGVRVFSDREGFESRLSGAATSGQVLLYDRDGHLRFNGGITGARGHAGDNEGLDAVIAQITTGSAGQRRGAVFGCGLFDPRSPGVR
jgi:hypothetical protein